MRCLAPLFGLTVGFRKTALPMSQVEACGEYGIHLCHLLGMSMTGHADNKSVRKSMELETIGTNLTCLDSKVESSFCKTTSLYEVLRVFIAPPKLQDQPSSYPCTYPVGPGRRVHLRGLERCHLPLRLSITSLFTRLIATGAFGKDLLTYTVPIHSHCT